MRRRIEYEDKARKALSCSLIIGSIEALDMAQPILLWNKTELLSRL